jgi:hypothetical protein
MMQVATDVDLVSTGMNQATDLANLSNPDAVKPVVMRPDEVCRTQPNTKRNAATDKKEKVANKKRKRTSTTKQRNTTTLKKKTTKKKKNVNKKKKQKQDNKKKIKSRRSIIRAPRSSWIAYLTDQRELHNENPEYANISFGVLCSKMSPAWKELTPEQRAPYDAAYHQDRQRYVRELAALPDADKKLLRAHRRINKKKRKGRPKAALSSFMLFAKEARSSVIEAEMPNKLEFSEIGKRLGLLWRVLDDTKKATYGARAATDRLRFNTELTGWKAAIAAEHEERKRFQVEERSAKKQTIIEAKAARRVAKLQKSQESASQ